MKISLATHGGLAAAINLSQPPRVVDAHTLTGPAAAELAQLVAAARVAGAGPAAVQPHSARDEMSYTITVQDGDDQVVLIGSDTTMAPEFGALLSWLEERS